MITLIYLSDVEPQGRGTMVWPGSNRKFRNVAQEQPGQYSHMDDLRPLVADLAQETPIETTPQRGDVVFIDYLMFWWITEQIGSTSTRPPLSLFVSRMRRME